MAMTPEQAKQQEDDFAAGYAEDQQKPADMTDDEAFGLAEEPAAEETPAEEISDQAAAAEGGGPGDTGTEQGGAPIAPVAEDAADGSNIESEGPTDPKDIQRQKSWEGRLKAKEAELKAREEALKAGAPALMQLATAIGIIWAGSLIASGMVANAALTSVVSLYASDPTQAAFNWQGIEPAIDGLGNANGEILGGLMTLLISLAALRAGELPKGLNIFGLVVGTVGIISLVPALTGMLGPVFGLTQIIWFIWMGIALLRSNPGKAASTERLTAA